MNHDAEKFAIFMAMLATAFEPKGIVKEKINLYYEFLKDVPIALIEKATHEIIKTRRFSSFPTIAEIREKALGSDEDIESRALIAWGEAASAVSRSSRNVSDDTDAAVKAAFGSWGRFGETDPDHEAADRAHFIRCYRVVAKRKRDGLLLPGGPDVKRITGGM